MTTIEKTITGIHAGLRIKELLKEEMGYSSRFVRKTAMSQRILVNGRAVKLDYILREGDQMVLHLSAKETQDIEAEDIALDILYEDDALLAINKDPGMVVHPTRMHTSGTLSNAVTHHYRSRGEKTIVRLVSRLDMDTSGVILLAKNQFVHSQLSRAMQANAVEKTYLALVKGRFPATQTEIDLPIYKEEGGHHYRVVDPRGQEALTQVQVLEAREDHTLLKLRLITGRTHQIRVHLSHMGYPILGDTLYGGADADMPRQALHATSLRFFHPVTGKPLALTAPLKEDMRSAAERLGFSLDLDALFPR